MFVRRVQRQTHMDKVKIPNAGIDQRFERGQSYTLEDTGPHEALVICTAGARPDTAYNHQNMSHQKQMALAPDARRGYDKNASYAHTAQVIAGQ